jgi:Ca-activated chloride channel family protein
MFEFAWSWVFILLPLPLLVYFVLRPAKKQQLAVVVPFYQQIAKKNSSAILAIRQKTIFSLILLTLLWLLIVAAAARPQWVGDPIAQATSGRDLLVAVDISDSMDQADMLINNEAATRLQIVKQVVSEFIQRRQGDRIGLVLFGTNAYLQAPLTFDTHTVAQFLDEAQLGFAGPKTAIGDAIGLSVKRLQALKNGNENRVIILLTDGANTAGEVEPLQAAALAEQTQIKIYTIGIGADEMVVRSFFGPRRVNPSAQLDEETLVNIASRTGGRYFRARDTKDLENIYHELDTLEPIIQEQEWLRPTRSLFMWPLATALLISLLLAALQLKKNGFLSNVYLNKREQR